MLNAIEPQSYIRPHRHLIPPKVEVFLVLRVAPPETFLKVDESAGKLTELVRTGPGAVEGGRDRCGL